MWKLTVDTNVMRDYAEPQRAGHQVAKKLMELHDSGRCEIRVTTRLDADVPRDPLRGKLESLAVLDRPAIGTVNRVGVSRIGSSDMIASEDWAREVGALMDLLFPGASKESERHSSRMADVDHLMGHKIADRDIFVTYDKAILNQRQSLATDFGITVMSAAEGVEQVSASSDGGT